MGAARILWAVCVVVASSEWAQAADECVVVAPHVLRLGARETVVAMVSGRDQTVNISLENLRPVRGAFFETTLDVTSGSPSITEVWVTPDDLPESQLTMGNATVKLKVACGTLWKSEVLLPVDDSSANHFFMQTDKPIYQPGSTVNIRFFVLNESMAPSATPFMLEIRNPHNVVLDAKKFVSNPDTMLSYQFNVPKHSVLGEWALVMRYGHKFRHNRTATFAVEKYVLPRFSLRLSTVDFILPDFDNITVSVRAKFTNQQIVRGSALFRFSVKNSVGHLVEIGTSGTPKELKAGDCAHVLSRSDVVAKLGEEMLAAMFHGRARLVVEATVIEEATGIRQSHRSEQAVFSNSPYLVSTARSERTFKAGVKFYVMAEVTYANGEPAVHVPTRLTSSNDKVQPMTLHTDENGMVTFLISSKSSDVEFKFTLETADSRFPKIQQARDFLVVSRYTDSSGKYVAIERKDPKALVEAGSRYEASLFKSSSEQLTSSYYVVLSRGRILAAGKVTTEYGVLDPKIAFTVTPEMTPSFRFLVFGFMYGYLVTDTVHVGAKTACTRDSQFTMTWNNPHAVMEPGASGTLVLKGKAGTRVGLLAVDKAVHALRRKDLLTQDEVSRSMEANDMGYGRDAGSNALQALSNSGVVLLASYKVFYGTPAEKRRRGKREAEMHAAPVKDSENETLRDSFTRRRPRGRFLRSYRPASNDLYAQTPLDNSFFKISAGVQESQLVTGFDADSADVLGDDKSSSLQKEEREDFRETWMFHQLTIMGGEETTYKVTAPDSITTWELSAISIAPSGGICVLDPLEVRVFKKLFVEVNLPHSVVQNEQINVPATVYNYDRVDRMVSVAMIGTRNVCSGAKEDRSFTVRKLVLPPGQGHTLVFPVVPLASGLLHIHVAALSDGSLKDAANVALKVEAHTSRMEESMTFFLDPQNTQRGEQRPKHGYRETFELGGKQLIQIRQPRRHSKKVVPGSEHCEIDIIGHHRGSVLEASVRNPENLLQMPTGSCETVMINFVPTLYAYRYLKITGRISSADEEKALNFIRNGYQRIVSYRKNDGSFATYQYLQSSLWLTAFVLRTLCEAQKYISVDEKIITSGLRYLLARQEQDGSFNEISKLTQFNLLFRDDGVIPLTVYTFLTLQECAQQGIQVPGLEKCCFNATAYTKRELKQDASPYVLSQAAYALSFCERAAEKDALRRLRSILLLGKDGGLHVPTWNESLSIEATSYALMAFINADESRYIITALAQWLHPHMNPSGPLSRSQETNVALQALSKYSIYAHGASTDLTCEVTLSNGRAFNRTILIDRENAPVRHKIEIPGCDDKILVSAKGVGSATMYFVRSYEELVEPDHSCQFNLDIDFRLHKADQTTALNSSKSISEKYSMKICARSLVKDLQGMVVLDVGLLAGFKPVSTHLEKLVAEKHLDTFEVSQRSVVLYLPNVPSDAPVCAEFGLRQEFIVGKVHSSSVKVYAYYEPDISCTKFYSVDGFSPLLKVDCNGRYVDPSGMCKCLEGGCPPRDALEMFTAHKTNALLKAVEWRENFRHYACYMADFVWVATARRKTCCGGFIAVVVIINEVLKTGMESEDVLVNKTRVIKARENCESFNLTEGSQYIVMGVDSKYKQQDLSESEPYEYVIDSDSVIIRLPSTKSKLRTPRPRGQQLCDSNKIVKWFLSEFSSEFKLCAT